MDPSELHRALLAEGVPAAILESTVGYAWSNGPGDVYGAHRHAYDKVLLCLAGDITFQLPGADREVSMTAGDRLDLPAVTLHAARVGPSGVRCHETHLPAGTLTRRA